MGEFNKDVVGPLTSIVKKKRCETCNRKFRSTWQKVLFVLWQLFFIGVFIYAYIEIGDYTESLGSEEVCEICQDRYGMSCIAFPVDNSPFAPNLDIEIEEGVSNEVVGG